MAAPAAAASAASARAALAHVPAIQGRLTGVEPIRPHVLAVIDGATDAGTLARRLERGGFAVDAVCSAETALAAAARLSPDLVLLGAGVPYPVGDALVRRLLRRTKGSRPPVLRHGDLELDAEQRRARRGGRQIGLTPTETGLLAALMARPERVLARAELMPHVRSRGGGKEDDNILEFFVSQLRRKLEAAGEPRLIHTVRGAGYVLRES